MYSPSTTAPTLPTKSVYEVAETWHWNQILTSCFLQRWGWSKITMKILSWLNHDDGRGACVSTLAPPGWTGKLSSWYFQHTNWKDYSNSPQTTLTLFNRHLNSGPGFTSQVNYLLLRSSFLILPTHLPFFFISIRPLLVWPGDLDSVIPILGSPRFCGIRRLFTNPSCVFVP